MKRYLGLFFFVLITSIPEAEALEIKSLTKSGPGVVVESVASQSCLSNAGLLPGDIVVGWQLVSTNRTVLQRGSVVSVFDWMWVELELFPRGGLVLEVFRDSQLVLLHVGQGWWQGEVRPRMTPSSKDMVLSFLRDLAAGPASRDANSITNLLDRIEDKQLRGWVLWQISEILLESGQLELGRTILDDALSDATSGNEAAFLSWQLGEIERRLPFPRNAEKSFMAAGREWRRLRPNDLAMAKVTNGLGLLEHIESKLENAIAKYRLVLGIRTTLAPQSVILAQAHMNISMALYGKGQLSEARKEITKAIEICSAIAPQSLPCAQVDSNSALIDWHQGNLVRALERLEEALDIQKDLNANPSNLASTYHFLACVAWELGDLEKSKSYFESAREIIEALEPSSYKMAAVYTGLAGLAHRRLELTKSIDFEKKALKIHREINPDSREVAMNLGNLASLAKEQGDFHRARSLISEAIGINEKASADIHRAFLYSTAGAIESAQDNWDQAVNWHELALAQRREYSPETVAVAKSLLNLGFAYWRLGEIQKAEKLLRESLAIRKELTPFHSGLALNYRWLAAVEKEKNHPDASRIQGFYRAAIDVLDAQLDRFGGSPNDQRNFWAGVEGVFDDSILFFFRQGDFRSAFLLAEKWKAKIIRNQLLERKNSAISEIPGDLIEKRLALSRKIDRYLLQLSKLDRRHDRAEIREMRESLERLFSLVEDVEEEAREFVPRQALDQAASVLSIDAAQQTLDRGTLLLSFIITEDETLLFSLTQGDELRVERVDISEKNLRLLVRKNLESQQSLRPRNTGPDRLCELLVEPVQDRIAASDRILIAADGPLHFLPWSSLQCRGASGELEYLVEWRPVHLELSASVYRQVLQRRPSVGERGSSQWSLVAFGDPTYPKLADQRNQSSDPAVRSVSTRRAFGFEPLPFTRREIAAISPHFPPNRTKALLGSEATEEALTELRGRIDVIHIATHSYADNHSPMSSYLALSIPPFPTPGRANGLLQVWEIYERLRFDADLVVLSACETALGAFRPGEGLIGLTRAFQYAGARSIIASMWRVDDESTATLMARFYYHLSSGMDKGEALRQAQIDLIKSDGGESQFSAPYYWAGFQLFGDWR